jgi:hypothetical protein
LFASKNHHNGIEIRNKRRKEPPIRLIRDFPKTISLMPLMIRMYPIHNGKKAYSLKGPQSLHDRSHEVLVIIIPISKRVISKSYHDENRNGIGSVYRSRCAPTGAMQVETTMTMPLAVETARPSPRAHLVRPMKATLRLDVSPSSGSAGTFDTGVPDRPPQKAKA